MFSASTDKRPRLEIVYPKTAQKEQNSEEILIEEKVEIRGWRAIGNKLPNDKFKEVRWLPSLPDPVEEVIAVTVEEDASEENTGEPEDNSEDVSGDTLPENTVNLTEETQEIREEESIEKEESDDEETKTEAKSKKDPKKGPDSKSQLGLFE